MRTPKTLVKRGKARQPAIIYRDGMPQIPPKRPSGSNGLTETNAWELERAIAGYVGKPLAEGPVLVVKSFGGRANEWFKLTWRDYTGLSGLILQTRTETRLYQVISEIVNRKRSFAKQSQLQSPKKRIRTIRKLPAGSKSRRSG